MVDGDSPSGQILDETSQGSGLYVDVENLNSDGQSIIQNLVEHWPETAPQPSRVSLYVRADQVELWKLWATSRFVDLKVVVHGTQHFSMSSSKNSADIAIATNAIADLILNRVTHVVVLSDDSDFISLYAAIRDEPNIPRTYENVPFLWVVTNRESSLSATVKQFFPPEQLHVVGAERKSLENVEDSELAIPLTSRDSPEQAKDIWIEMGLAVLQEIPTGPFKSTDCQPVIKKRWPHHSLAKAGGAAFGIEFKNNVWPVLKNMGVKIENPGRKPIRYEMTTEAKGSLP